MGLAFDTAKVVDADFDLRYIDIAPVAAGDMLVLAKQEVGGVDLAVRLLEDRGGNFDSDRIIGLVGCLCRVSLICYICHWHDQDCLWPSRHLILI